jgi:hypothetical protein
MKTWYWLHLKIISSDRTIWGCETTYSLNKLDTLDDDFIFIFSKMYLSKINPYMLSVNFICVSASCLLGFIPDPEDGGRTSF